MNQRQVLKGLIRSLSYREGDFTLASGQKSQFYIDLKSTTLHPEGALLTGELLAGLMSQAQLQSGVQFQGVGGMSIGADPIATAVSIAGFRQSQSWPAFLVRKEVKDHGTSRQIEGTDNLPKGAILAVVEDVVTTGGSSLKAIEILRKAGYQPTTVFALVDRCQGGREAFRMAGIELYSLFTITDIQKNEDVGA